MPKCVNLKELAGDKYRVTLDPAAHHEDGGTVDPWYFEIPCERTRATPKGERNHIFPHSKTHLSLWWYGRERLKWPELEI
jgi:hypothetical protein